MDNTKSAQRDTGWYMTWHPDVDGGKIGVAVKWDNEKKQWTSWRFNDPVDEGEFIAIGGRIG